MNKPLALITVVAGLCTTSVASAQSASDPNCAPDTNCAQSSALAASPRQSGQLSTPWRYAAEVGGGYAGALGGGLVGGGVGFAGGLIYVLATDSSSSGIFSVASVAGFTVIGSVLGAAAGAPYGVYLGGEAAGARGSLGATYLGGAVGLAAGLGGYFLTQVNSSGDSVGALDIVGLVLLFGAPVVGSMVGYELSLDASSQATVGTLSSPRPTVSISPSGDRGYVGLGWTF